MENFSIPKHRKNCFHWTVHANNQNGQNDDQKSGYRPFTRWKGHLLHFSMSNCGLKLYIDVPPQSSYGFFSKVSARMTHYLRYSSWKYYWLQGWTRTNCCVFPILSHMGEGVTKNWKVRNMWEAEQKKILKKKILYHTFFGYKFTGYWNLPFFGESPMYFRKNVTCRPNILRPPHHFPIAHQLLFSYVLR